MKCPHCNVAFIDRDHQVFRVEEYEDESFCLIARICPICKQVIVELSYDRVQQENLANLLGRALTGVGSAQSRRPFRQWTKLIWPTGVARDPVPVEVPEEYAKDYKEAALVLAAGSANASAALSRRCLQNIIRHELGVNRPNLYQEIEEVLNDPDTHSQIKSSLHYLRELGNFAAHPEKGNNTGAIVDVEEGEAEWCLDTIEMLFEIYFVRPAKDEEMRAIIDAKKSQI